MATTPAARRRENHSLPMEAARSSQEEPTKGASPTHPGNLGVRQVGLVSQGMGLKTNLQDTASLLSDARGAFPPLAT